MENDDKPMKLRPTFSPTKVAIALGCIVFILVMVLSYLIMAGAVWIVCWAFDFDFSWKAALGIFVIYMIVAPVFMRGNSK